MVSKNDPLTSAFYDPLRHNDTNGSNRKIYPLSLSYHKAALSYIKKCMLCDVHGIFMRISHGRKDNCPNVDQ